MNTELESPILNTLIDFYLKFDKPTVTHQKTLIDALLLIKNNDAIAPPKMVGGLLNKEYVKYKENQQCVCYPAQFNGYKKANNIKIINNLMFIDFDNLTPEESLYYKGLFTTKYDWIVACNLSTSLHGVHFIISISDIHKTNPLLTNNDRWNAHNLYHDAFHYIVSKYFNPFLVDGHCADYKAGYIYGYSVISKDPDIYINYNPTTLNVDVEDVILFNKNNPKPIGIQSKDKSINNEPKKVKTEKDYNFKHNYTWDSLIDVDGVMMPLKDIYSSDPVRKSGLIFEQALNEDLFVNKDVEIHLKNKIPRVSVVSARFMNKKIISGYRHTILGTICMEMVYLNENLNDKSEILTYIRSINNKNCSVPMEDAEINSIFNYNIECQKNDKSNFDDNVLRASNTLIRTLWSKYTNVLADEKNSITHIHINEPIKLANYTLIHNAIEDLSLLNMKIKNVDIVSITNLSKRTVENYLTDYPQLKSKIDVHSLTLNIKIKKKSKKVQALPILEPKEKQTISIESACTFLYKTITNRFVDIMNFDFSTLIKKEEPKLDSININYSQYIEEIELPF